MLGVNVSGLSSDITNLESGRLWAYLYAGTTSGLEGRRAAALAYLSRPPDFEPGTTYAWIWINAMILGLVVEEQTGDHYEMIIDRELFRPLEMQSATFTASRNRINEGPTNIWPHKGEGTTSGRSNTQPLDSQVRGTSNPLALRPADGAHASVKDMAKFAKLHLDGLNGYHTPILSPEAFRDLHAPCGTTSCGSTQGGWQRASRPWASGFASNIRGRSGGFAARCWIVPGRQEALLSLANHGGLAGWQATDEGISLCIQHACLRCRGKPALNRCKRVLASPHKQRTHASGRLPQYYVVDYALNAAGVWTDTAAKPSAPPTNIQTKSCHRFTHSSFWTGSLTKARAALLLLLLLPLRPVVRYLR